MARVSGLSVGVEEEFQIVDATTGRLASRAEDVLAALEPGAGTGAGSVVKELPLSQVETVSAVCSSLAEVHQRVGELRRTAAAAAARVGARLLSSGMPPLGDPGEQRVASGERYDPIVARTAVLVREQFIAGVHVHVGIDDDDLRVAVVDRMRPWLPVLTALGANSPYTFGTDTGFSSFRTANWGRWPVTGPPPRTGDKAGWDAAVAALVRAGAVLDGSYAYWDARLSSRFPTVEVRCMDALPALRDVVVLTGLVRALAATALDDAGAGRAVLDPANEVLRAANWHSARYGLTGDLVDPATGGLGPAAEVVRALLRCVHPALVSAGDEAVVASGVAHILVAGNGAQRQRAAFAAGGLSAVVALLDVAAEP